MHNRSKGMRVLLRFEVSNHRSIMDPVELSMIAVDTDRPAVRTFDRLPESVLTVAGIYGPNASGKSNVLDALMWLSSAVGNSLRAWEDLIPRDPFRFGDGPQTPSTYEVDMIVSGVRYTYRLEVDDCQVIFESLHSYPERRPRTLFEREGMEISFRRGLGGQLGIRELLTPTTLALSATVRFDEAEIRMFGRSLVNIGLIGIQSTRRRWKARRPSYLIGRHHSTERIFYQDVTTAERLEERDAVLSLLRYADLGIEDVEVVKLVSASNPQAVGRDLRLVHRVAGQRSPIEMDDESEGTLTWFRLVGPALYALRNGQTLLCDELDASLHPRLSARMVELFQDPQTNPHGAQLIFTTHDTSLLNHLNRDEVWLTEKSETGTTSLTALAEYGGEKVRRSLNLEKAYLQGRFGAVPELDQYLLHRALGLTTDGG